MTEQNDENLDTFEAEIQYTERIETYLFDEDDDQIQYQETLGVRDRASTRTTNIQF